MPGIFVSQSSPGCVFAQIKNSTPRRRQKCIPQAWRHSRISTIYKKGDESLPQNYRPISLLAVSYKVLASLLLKQIAANDAEDRIRATQSGFRKDRGAGDAIFVMHRLIERAWATKLGKLSAILLDWSKALDRIDPAALLIALTRFGIPGAYTDMIAAIYKERTFEVRYEHRHSERHVQSFGIAQGCPLSPYLFIIMLSVLMEDVQQDVILEFGAAPTTSIHADIAYADDTALVSDNIQRLQFTLERLIVRAVMYGLTLNLDKTVQVK